MRPSTIALLCLIALPAGAQTVPTHPPITPPPTPPEVIAPRQGSTTPNTSGVIAPPNVDPEIAVRPTQSRQNTPVIKPDGTQKPGNSEGDTTPPKASP